MYRTEGGGRQFWALWDSAQKVTFVVPWLIDEINRRSGDRIKINLESLTGTDDRGVEVAAKLFNGKVESKSGQVNWQGLRSKAPGHEREYQLVLVNHAEATDVTIMTPFGSAPASARIFDPAGKSREAEFSATAKRVSVRIPKQQMMIIVWTPVE